ncbi:MAG: DUF4244 domain-containing protein [Actinobacteria bacterium]|nr:DUF4244 domain-containing protein [Actinomycetota bacterium]
MTTSRARLRRPIGIRRRLGSAPSRGPRPADVRRWREAGMTTAEYAIGTIAACTFAALLIAIVRSPEIKESLLRIITSALGLGG